MYNPPKLNHEEIKHVNKLKTSEEMKEGIKNLPKKERPRPDDFPGEFYQILEEKTSILLKLF